MENAKPKGVFGKPPLGNRNGMRHGLTAGKLPLNCAYIENLCNRLRRQLEDSVMQQRGEVTLADADSIQTAVKWERHGALALRWLRVKGDELKPTESLTFSREIAKASTERDKAIIALRLHDDSRSMPWVVRPELPELSTAGDTESPADEAAENTAVEEAA